MSETPSRRGLMTYVDQAKFDGAPARDIMLVGDAFEAGYARALKDAAKPVRDYMLGWINSQRGINMDLFYRRKPKHVVLDEFGINTATSARWPLNFDFGILPDERLAVEFTHWMIYSMRQR